MAGVKTEARFWNGIASMIPTKGSLNSGSLALAQKFLKSREGFRKGLQHIQQQTGVRIGIMYPPNEGLIAISNEPGEVKAAVLAAAKSACQDLGEKMDIKFL